MISNNYKEFLEKNDEIFTVQNKDSMIKDMTLVENVSNDSDEFLHDVNFAHDALQWLHSVSNVDNESVEKYSIRDDVLMMEVNNGNYEVQSPIVADLLTDGEDYDEKEKETLSTSDQHEFNILQLELQALQARKNFIEFNRQHDYSPILQYLQGRTMIERQQLLQAQATHAFLTKTLQEERSHTSIVMNFLYQAPINDYRKALMTPLESYIHLPKEFDERRRILEELRRERCTTSYNYAMQVLQHINPLHDFSHTEAFEKFGILYIYSATVSQLEGCAQQRASDIVVRHYLSKGQHSHTILGPTYFEIKDMVMDYMLQGQFLDKLSYPKRGIGDCGYIVLNSNVVMYRFEMPNGDTVLISDYINQDDLYHYPSKLNRKRYRKDLSSCMILSRYTDKKGVEGTIFRNISCIRYHFPAGPPPTTFLKDTLIKKARNWARDLITCFKYHHIIEEDKCWDDSEDNMSGEDDSMDIL